jgi:hypothetical protein
MAIGKMLLLKVPSHYTLVGVTWLRFLMSGGYEQINTSISSIYAMCSKHILTKINHLFTGVSKNIFQHNFFIILESLEMIAQLCICSILFLTVIVPMHWLASNAFKFAHRGWGEKLMGQVTDLPFTALVSIQSDGKLILDFNFTMNIFADLKHKSQEFDTYSIWSYYKKEGNKIGLHSIKERVLPVDQGMAMLFYPQEVQNRLTNSLQLGSELATSLIQEIEDPRKENGDYLSIVDGKHSYAQV